MPNSQGGTPNSAAVGSTGVSRSPSQRCRFHQPDTSETQYSALSGPHAGWITDAPPATRRGADSAPSAVTSATHSAVSSHGMFGWFQQTHASRRPSGLSRGAA